MTVDDASHIAAMKRDPRVSDNIAVETFHATVTNGRHCPACSFSAWPWQTTCPKCGAATEGDE